MENLFNTSGINLHAKCSSTLIFMPTFCCCLLLTHSSTLITTIIVELFNPFSCVPTSPSFSLARCQVMKQSIKELCYELFFLLLRVPPSWKQQQQEGFYKLILFNLNLFIAKNFFIMRLFSPDVVACSLHIVRNNNEFFQNLMIYEMREKLFIHDDDGDAVKAPFFRKPHTHSIFNHAATWTISSIIYLLGGTKYNKLCSMCLYAYEIKSDDYQIGLIFISKLLAAALNYFSASSFNFK